MSHLAHIQKHKPSLDLRWEILRATREFFWSEGFQEVETPIILRLPGQEPYLSPMKIGIHDEQKRGYTGYLHTSPEYAMKKMLAAGYEKIFSICKTFRDYESFGGTHNPEFTMIEWYRTGVDFWTIMDDCERLLSFIDTSLTNKKIPHAALPLQNPERLHMRDAWQRYAGVNLDDYLERDTMFALCKKKGYTPDEGEPFDDLFFRIFLNEIEPHLGKEHLTLLHHYPLSMAALSKQSADDPRYAERCEMYLGGLELSNGFTELTDADEQLGRLQEEQAFRKKMGKEVYDIDMEFIEALRSMPPASGIALGMDRLVQLFGGCQNIDGVLVLPASKLFDT
ncbi:MAG TPA: EF-P lysine aminoacylase EpmA [Candidatus Kapabacteria bacterium]|nr:EF-P lysine aminoacylase EpmA [Candidatus Kapabacteria bacterium]